MGQIARRLTDDKDAIHSELIELRTSTNMKIHQLEREVRAREFVALACIVSCSGCLLKLRRYVVF